jgi:hypothetical protein
MAGFCVVSATTVLGGQFSFVSDFLISPNEANSATNVWQYFYGVDTRNRSGVYQRLPVFAIGIANSGTDGWRAAPDDAPYIGVHVRSDNIFPYVAIGEGHVHPGNDGLGVAIGFRAPSNGVYQVSGSVRAAAGGSINWHLYRGTSSNLLAGGRHLQAKQNRNFDTPPINLSVGEFVFLVVDNDGDWGRDSTAVEYVVQAFERAPQLGVHPVTYADINAAKFQLNKDVSERLHVLLMIYGPSLVGFVVLLAACVFIRRKRTLIGISIGATALHLITVHFLLTLASIGSGGNSSAFVFVGKYLFVGLGAIAVLIAIKVAVIATRTRPGDSPSSGKVSVKREPPVLQN